MKDMRIWKNDENMEDKFIGIVILLQSASLVFHPYHPLGQAFVST